MTSRSSYPTFPCIAAACVAGIALLATVDRAEAGKGRSVRGQIAGSSTANPSPVVRDHRGTASKLHCVGPNCPGSKVNGVRGTTTGTYKAPCKGHFCPHTH